MSRKPERADAPYAGRWVARVQDRIVGHGGTPDAADRAARASRHKERAEISYIGRSWPPEFEALIAEVVALIPEGDVFLVGGAVRDSLIGRPSHDFDFVVPADSIRVARRLASALDADFYVLDAEFGAARVLVRRGDGTRDNLDFALMRGGSIHADLVARDFTINAIALNARDMTTLDPLHGTADLRAKLIRSSSAEALSEDPIRILRAVRLAAALDFRIEAKTRQAMKRSAHRLSSISAERKRDELFRMLSGPRPDACMRALEMLAVLPHFLPELGSLKGVRQPPPHVHDAWEHTLSVMRHLGGIMDLALDGKVEDANGFHASLLTLGIGRYRSQLADDFSASPNPERSLRGLLQFAALYHDVGKGATFSQTQDGRIHFFGHEKVSALRAGERARLLNLSNSEVEWIVAVVTYHLRLFFMADRMESNGEAPSGLAIHRFFRDAGPAAVGLVLLGLADLRGTRDHTLTEKTWSTWIGVARLLLDNLWARPSAAVAPARFLDGNDLMRELQLAPGPLVGKLLEAIREAQAAGDVEDRDAAIAFAREWIQRTNDTRAP